MITCSILRSADLSFYQGRLFARRRTSPTFNHFDAGTCSDWKEVTQKMEISRQEFEDFSPKKVHEFVREKSLLDEEEAVKLLNNKVDGYALLHSPVDEVRNVYGLLPGPAKSLVGKLAQMFPGEDFIQCFPVYMVFVCLCISTRMSASYLKHCISACVSPSVCT
jgi:hypothetical protein